MTISNANIEFNENGTPIATDFADIYFSDNQGLDETYHVFLLNNAIPERWHNWSANYFTIAETGFGTGLNFLATLELFNKYLATNPYISFNLHFISIEKFPITLDDLTTALAVYPNLKAYVEPLLAQYPLPIAGCHRLSFLQGRVTLDLWLGDVHQVLPQLDNPPAGLVDAWFLDGFAPSKNPEMWSQALFEHMAQLAKDDCTFATFTAAGHVRRGLIEAGFNVEKRKGHGRKREMLAGNISKPNSNVAPYPYFMRSSYISTSVTSKANEPRIAIIGGGLAGANCAYALAKKGLTSTIYCKENALAQGASGNPQAGFYPHLNATAGIISQIQVSGFNYAARLYQQLLADGYHFTHQWCGTLLVAFNDKVTTRYQKLVKNKTWPEALIHWVEKQQASELANIHLPYAGLFIPSAGWINPVELIQALIIASQGLVSTNKSLQKLNKQDNVWQLTWADGSQTEADIVILATGSDSVDTPYLEDLPFRLVRGQVEAVPSNAHLQQLSTVLCHKGYLTPAWQQRHALGSTYIKDDRNCEYRDAEQATNLAMQQKALAQCDWVQQIQADNTGRAAIRASTPDHLPMVGAVPNIQQQKIEYHDLYKSLPAKRYPPATDHQNLFMLSGLGSRGLNTAPLCAEILASQITGQALPLANHLLNALNPNRFLIKGLIRREI